MKSKFFFTYNSATSRRTSNAVSYTGLRKEDIEQVEQSVFRVKSEHGDSEYDINFGDDLRLPSCTCHNWKKMMSIINHIEGVSWEAFGKIYRDSVFLNLDFEVFGVVKHRG